MRKKVGKRKIHVSVITLHHLAKRMEQYASEVHRLVGGCSDLEMDMMGDAGFIRAYAEHFQPRRSQTKGSPA